MTTRASSTRTAHKSPLLAALGVALAGCAGQVGADSAGATADGALTVPAQVRVDGHVVDVEATYLPRVVQCENPGASFEAMKAQAVAARTYLTYRANGKSIPTIHDGQADQVYTCPSNHYGAYVSDDAAAAVAQTAGQVVLYDGAITAGFFVAGASRNASDSCKRTTDPTSTEHFVTYNYGLTGSSVNGSSIGFKANVANRGCFSQRLADCLAATQSYAYTDLLRYFYGSDAQVASVGSDPLDSATVSAQATADAAQATCYSSTFALSTPLDACVLSSDGTYYQCEADGSWSPASSTGGTDGACSSVYGN